MTTQVDQEAKEAKRFVREIAKGAFNIAEVLDYHVIEMCKVLEKAQAEYHGSSEDSEQGLEERFRRIFWALKLHMVFHYNVEEANELKELQEAGKLVGLTNKDDMERIPNMQDGAMDPVSILLEILGIVFDAESCPRGSRQHAEKVFDEIKKLLSELKPENIFRPKVLAIVNHNDKFFVGSSIAVSHIMRPFYLYTRIKTFKCCLQKAVVYYNPLNTADKNNWSSSAYYKKSYTTEIPPCKNCQMMFKNLSGFIPGDKSKTGEAAAGGATFLGACAEYCPVDLLADANALPQMDMDLIANSLRSYKDQCILLFENYTEVRKRCVAALKSMSKDVKEAVSVYREMAHIVYIFGTKPECNDKLRFIKLKMTS